MTHLSIVNPRVWRMVGCRRSKVAFISTRPKQFRKTIHPFTSVPGGDYEWQKWEIILPPTYCEIISVRSGMAYCAGRTLSGLCWKKIYSSIIRAIVNVMLREWYAQKVGDGL